MRRGGALRHPDRSAPRLGLRFAVGTGHLCQIKLWQMKPCVPAEHGLTTMTDGGLPTHGGLCACTETSTDLAGNTVPPLESPYLHQPQSSCCMRQLAYVATSNLFS